MVVAHFLSYQKMEEDRVNKEHQLQMERMMYENERRREEREHEMNMLRMIMGPQPLSTFPNIHSQLVSSVVPFDEASASALHCS